MATPLRPIKTAIRTSLSWLGYEIRRPSYGHENDPLDAVSRLAGQSATVVIDVGAHMGQSADRFLGRFPAAKLHLFEPFPDSMQHLRARFAGEARVALHEEALAAAPGHADFYVNKISATNSLLPLSTEVNRHVDPRLYETRERIRVVATTLDAFCRERLIETVDLLKIDVQGAELEVLKGANELLASGAVRVVYLEAHFKPIYSGQADFCTISARLHERGYRVYGIYDMNFGLDGGLAWADAIFTRPSAAG